MLRRSLGRLLRAHDLACRTVVESRIGEPEYLDDAPDKLPDGAQRAAAQHQRANQLIQPLDLEAPHLGFGRSPACALGKLAGRHGSHQKRQERDPVLRVRHRESRDRRQKEIVEAEDGQQRRRGRFTQPPFRGDPEHHQQQAERNRGVIDRQQRAKQRDSGCYQQHGGRISRSFHVRPNRRSKYSRVRCRM